MRPALALLLLPATAAAHAGGVPTTARPLVPTGPCEPADTSYEIRWTDLDDRAETDTWISWSYTDRHPPTFWPGATPVGLTGVTIAEGIEERDPHNRLVWDTSRVPAGAYFLWSLADDPPWRTITFSSGVVVVAHEGDPVWPTVIFTEPDGLRDRAGDAFTIGWAACDPDGTGRVRLEATARTDGEGLEPIAGDLDPQGGLFTWDTSALCPGPIYLRATIEDARGISFSTFADHFVTIDHGWGWDAAAHGCQEGEGGSGGWDPAGQAEPTTPGRPPAPCGCGGAPALVLLVLPRRMSR